MAEDKLIGQIIQDDTLYGIISSEEELSGSISVQNNGLIGTISYKTPKTADETIIGYIVESEELSGVISNYEELTGIFSISDNGLIGTLTYGAGSTIIDYKGPYFTIPTADVQKFGTKNKKMLDDFTVDATPISDVRTVETDGYTITVL